MLERYLTDALTTHFGHFVENLDSDKVRLSAWNGELVLSDLLLKRNALEALGRDSPVEIAYGRIGNLELRIPWKLLRSQLRWRSTTAPSFSQLGCTVVLSDVNILVTPKRKRPQRDDENENDEESMSPNERRAQKEKEVQQLLDANLFQRVAGTSQSSSTSTSRWVRQLVTNLLSNLSVTIRNVHIRYEDPGSCLGFVWTDQGTRQSRNSFAIGITLRQFSVQTTDRGDPEGEQDEGSNDFHGFSLRHKLAAVYQLAIYWDRGCHLMASNVLDIQSETDSSGFQSMETIIDERNYFASAFAVLNDGERNGFVHQNLYQPEHTYALHPVSPSLHFSLVDTMAPVVGDDIASTDTAPPPPRRPIHPPSSLAMSFPPCQFSIARNALEDTAYLRKSIAMWNHARKGILSESSLRHLTKLRPLVSPLKDPRSWWQYAFQATVLLMTGSRDEGRLTHPISSGRRRRGWLGIARVLHERKQYIRHYETVLYSVDEKIREQAHNYLLEMENFLLIEEIVAFRIAAYAMTTEKRKRFDAQNGQGNKSWSAWMRGTSKKVTTLETTTVSDAVDSRMSLESATIPAGNVSLSIQHRCRMFGEMAQALEREEANQVIAAREMEDSTDAGLPDSNPTCSPIVWKTSLVCPELALQVNEQFPDGVSPKASGRWHDRDRPVVRLSCAAIQRQQLHEDGSWEVECTVASLEVKDLTLRSTGKSLSLRSRAMFPNLLGSKPTSPDRDEINGDTQGDVVTIHGVPHHVSVSITLRRKVERYRTQGTETIVGSTTCTVIRLLPLEVVYSTDPVAALARVFSTVKTPELADDYYRMASVVAQWRDRQRKRLLQALAHRRKKIVIDLDVAAPVILIPEDLSREDCPLLVVDLGRLRFSNVEGRANDTEQYDDQWQLTLSHVQVQCSSASSHRSASDMMHSLHETTGHLSSQPLHQLVEPFSLQFTVATRITDEDSGVVDDTKAKIVVIATLPRLMLNLTSSAVRLVQRLKLQWAQRKTEMRERRSSELMTEWNGLVAASGLRTSSLPTSGQGATTENRHSSIKRTIVFRFSAPLIALKVENDVDGRDCTDYPQECTRHLTTRLVDLTLQGIRGTLVQKVVSDATTAITFDAKLHSVEAVDHYQRAGDEYALLMSSLSPDSLSSHVSANGSVPWELSVSDLDMLNPSSFQEVNDLVSILYSSRSNRGSMLLNGSQNGDDLAIQFHELYIEWNPETIAAMHKAMMLPLEDEETNNEDLDTSSDRAGEGTSESDEEFYDAVQDEGFGPFPLAQTESNENINGGGSHLISEISSCGSSFSDATDILPEVDVAEKRLEPYSPSRQMMKNISLQGMNAAIVGESLHTLSGGSARNKGAMMTQNSRPFHFTFDLSKLCVNFNKESRHRRLVTAEMDGTSIQYTTKLSGGSRTVAKIGNLTFSDPANMDSATLYTQILGLQSESYNQSPTPSSLLQMELVMNPKTRTMMWEDIRLSDSYKSSQQRDDNKSKAGVTINCGHQSITGCDSFLSLQFSPMRFVYLQQLWFEIIDYFFEGIIGYEVWGKERPNQNGLNIVEEVPQRTAVSRSEILWKDLPGASARDLSFTKFQISIDSPVVLVPVTYRSPQFMRLEFSTLNISNHYTSQREYTEHSATLTKATGLERVQWYNNCDVDLRDLRITSWCGVELSCRSASRASVGMSASDDNQHESHAHITLNWPTGPSARFVMPKWKIECSIDTMTIFLRRTDYALLQHIVVYNIGEPSRHLDEWDALQNLPTSDLERYKKQIMVHFGYDKKDTAPTTYSIQLSNSLIRFFLCDDVNESVIAEAQCTDLKWQMKKLSDRISWSRITCDVVLLKPGMDSENGAAIDLLLPSDSIPFRTAMYNAAETAPQVERKATVPELAYTSISQPSGDSVKTLEVSDACIHLVYAAWMTVKHFFTNLGDPTILTKQEVQLSIQIGDRWYRIGDTTFNGSESTVETSGKTLWSRNRKSSIDDNSPGVLLPNPSFHFHLRLRSPRIILSSGSSSNDENCVILRMGHMDFLYENDGPSSTMIKSFFIHDLELYTSSRSMIVRQDYVSDNSLIHPWCVGGIFDRCNGQSIGNCDQHTFRISADVLHARSAYSDISIAVDVGLRLLCDLRSSRTQSSDDGHTESKRIVQHLTRQDDYELENSWTRFCEFPLTNSLVIGCDGVEACVIDDSKRHFANAQELIALSLGEISFVHRVERQRCDSCRGPSTPTLGAAEQIDVTTLRLHRVDLFDCLQPIQSPFRLIATSRPTHIDLSFNPIADVGDPGQYTRSTRRMVWEEFCMQRREMWGYKASQALKARLISIDAIRPECSPTDDRVEPPVRGKYTEEKRRSETLHVVEIHSTVVKDVSTEYSVNLRTLILQWNPSTVIALQRFLGRLVKEAKMKSTIFSQVALNDLVPSAAKGLGSEHLPSVPLRPTLSNATILRASCSVKTLTVCLNKEHQSRRLLHATFSGSCVHVERDKIGSMSVEGYVENFYASDSDNYAERGLQEMLLANRRLISVLNVDQATGETKSLSDTSRSSFFKFRYKTFAKDCSNKDDSIPGWVQSHLATSGDSSGMIDDYLCVAIATLQLNYIRERTEEILDYLSNGLPGKGMGATSKAAQGFINKRIQTKSYLELTIDAPQVRIPRHEAARDGILLRLGDVNVKSWFEKATDTNLTPANQYAEERSVWNRLLSLSLLGLGWNTYEAKQSLLAEEVSTSVLPINLFLNLSKPTGQGRTVTMRGKLSYVDVTLKYTAYTLLRAVIRDNIGRDFDTSHWDNVEKAYWMEEANIETTEAATKEQGGIVDDGKLMAVDIPNRVAYSSNARFIRYGKSAKSKGSALRMTNGPSNQGDVPFEENNDLSSPRQSADDTVLDFVFELDGLSVKLHRDDKLDELEGSSLSALDISSVFHYDMIVLRVQMVEVSVSTNSAGDKSLHLSLYRIGLFDLGDLGRLARERYRNSMSKLSLVEDAGEMRRFVNVRLRKPCAFSILAEGYPPSAKHGHSTESDKQDYIDPQLVVTIDTCPISSIGSVGTSNTIDDNYENNSNSSKVTVARIVINYLSVNMLVRPLRETVAFLTCSWRMDRCESRIPVVNDRNRQNNQENDAGWMSATQHGAGLGTPESVNKGFQVKLVAHYPRIFFVADESDPHSRALVLCGLAVVNASIMTQIRLVDSDFLKRSGIDTEMQGFSDCKVVTAVDAHLHRMESYINPDVDNALGLKPHHSDILGIPVVSHSTQTNHDSKDGDDHLLGVALIEPVTAGMEFCQIKRDRFPTLRTVSVNMEPVSTMLSFEDLTLIETVLQRLTSNRQKKASMGKPVPRDLYCVDIKETEKRNELVDEFHPIAVAFTFDVDFTSSRLGLVLRKSGNVIVVDSVLSGFEHSDTIREGDILTMINGERVNVESLQEVVEQLKMTQRPMRLTFHRQQLDTLDSGVTHPESETDALESDRSESSSAQGTNGDESVSSDVMETISIDSARYRGTPQPHTVFFNMGVPTGLEIEKSVCGNVPVVVQLLPLVFVNGVARTEMNDSQQEQATRIHSQCNANEASSYCRIPRPGAIITHLDGVPVTEQGFDDTMQTLKRFASLTMALDENIEASNVSPGMTYSITFVDLHTSMWGNVDNVDVAVAGVTLTFIDDVKGRDMPLLRGRLNGIEVHIERGIGLETSVIYALPPTLLNVSTQNLDHSNGNNQIVSESILKFSAMARTEIDYYHPRIAVWEPLVEPSPLCVLFERQAGSRVRPGQVAVELSDRFLHGPRTGRHGAVTKSAYPNIVSVNFSESAAEVIVRASNEWRDWRQGAVTRKDSYEGRQSISENLSVADTSDQSGDVASRTHPQVQDSSNYLKSDSPTCVPHLSKHLSQSSSRIVKSVAAQKAAHAALVFAQKRGASIQKKGESAKPFMFRNRTGMSLTFFQQLPIVNERTDRPAQKACSIEGEIDRNNTPGRNGNQMTTTLADGNEARFQMEAAIHDHRTTDVTDSKSKANDSTNENLKRIRTYEGQYPCLTVLVEPIRGVAVEPLVDLRVFKVGSVIRHLKIRKLNDREEVGEEEGGSMGATYYSVPVVWTVEIQDNRRILTLSSAVRVLSVGLNTSIDIGVQYSETSGLEYTSTSQSLGEIVPDSHIKEPSSVIRIGAAKPGLPFYLPLWLSLRCEEVGVYIRPSTLETTGVSWDDYEWSQRSVLAFVPISGQQRGFEGKILSRIFEAPLDDGREKVTKWGWKETFSTVCSIACEPSSGEGIPTADKPIVCLSCHSASPLRGRDEISEADMSKPRVPSSSKLETRPKGTHTDLGEVISIIIDASVSVRNMLPVNLLWEVGSSSQSGLVTIDGSDLRKQKLDLHGSIPFGCKSTSICEISSGDCVEVFACDSMSTDNRVRFRFHSEQAWSQWAPLPSVGTNFDHRCIHSIDSTEMDGAEDHSNSDRKAQTTRQLNVQIKDDFGIPLTIGVRIIPKICKAPHETAPKSFGIDVVVYAELWLCNLTSLPLAFGCPSTQISASHNRELGAGDGTESDDAVKVAAEAALMEIASVLEFGDKGKGFSNVDDDGETCAPDLDMLPYQECDLLSEEVFEYIEIESSTVKRRWWGSEKQDSRRQEPLRFKTASPVWCWINDSWQIDCSGQATAREGGWESCRSILGGNENDFSARRTFDPNHSFRRRRWFRQRRTGNDPGRSGRLLGGIHAFHQPIIDSFSRAQERAERNAEARQQQGSNDSVPSESCSGTTPSYFEKGTLQISIKCGDGQWSKPADMSNSGGSRGVVRVLASRWPLVTKTSGLKAKDLSKITSEPGTHEGARKDLQYAKVNLSPELFELCYTVSDLGGDWGELSRLCLVTPRFMLRNDSEQIAVEVKQTGAPDESAIPLRPGKVIPFYWADFRLPLLASVRPLADHGGHAPSYKWSGGFDVCTLGMSAVRVRPSRQDPSCAGGHYSNDGIASTPLKSIRNLIEIRPGTGGTGINISFREEDSNGDGSLFRIENLSPFPIWLAQDGVLANPSAALGKIRTGQHDCETEFPQGIKEPTPFPSDTQDPTVVREGFHSESDGDYVSPMSRTTFALDIPFRQGKYAGRKAATMSELLRVRVGLAPLSSRDGIESTKVISFAEVGESVRLNPSKLSILANAGVKRGLLEARILGVVATDGPSRVLRFCLMRKEIPANVFGSTLTETVPYDMQKSAVAFYRDSSSKHPVPKDPGRSRKSNEYFEQATVTAALHTAELVETGQLAGEGEAKRLAFFGAKSDQPGYKSTQPGQDPRENESMSNKVEGDCIFSFRASFSGFVCSLIDSAPSEIAVVSLKTVNALAKWNAKRTTDASALVSVGWVQVDNHVPSAPFPVAVCPDEDNFELGVANGDSTPKDSTERTSQSPLLLIGLTFAPKHKSGILCLRSVTIAPRNLLIAVDLAFLVRLQRFFVGIGDHVSRIQVNEASTELVAPGSSVMFSDQKRVIPFPDIASKARELEGAGAVGVGSQKLYFEGLTILPCNVNLSVAPARALTPAQAALEGVETAAIHAAVRKGDVLLGSGVLGVDVGRKNKTAMAVVRGVFKSIVVDALLRCDGASLNFSGVFLRNHISTGPQLKTYLAAHYLASLRSNMPALLGSLAAFGNPLGLIRGLGDGVSDFVTEPVKGLRKSMQELDPFFIVDGVARGTESLARHAVGGFADSASLLTETFSKNMAVLTLDRRYAQRRDRRNTLRNSDGEMSVTFVEGVESGVVKLVRGVMDGVTGVVRAPMRGAERSGMEGFAKGIGKGLLGLLVKPVIGLSDAATDVMIGVKGSVDGGGGMNRAVRRHQLRPRRPMYGRDRVLRPYQLADAAAATLMLRTKLAGENYLSHYDMGDRVALLSVKRVLVFGVDGRELLMVKFKHIKKVEVQPMVQPDGSDGWGLVIQLTTPRKNGSEVEVICCKEKEMAVELRDQMNRGVRLVSSDA